MLASLAIANSFTFSCQLFLGIHCDGGFEQCLMRSDVSFWPFHPAPGARCCHPPGCQAVWGLGRAHPDACWNEKIDLALDRRKVDSPFQSTPVHPFDNSDKFYYPDAGGGPYAHASTWWSQPTAASSSWASCFGRDSSAIGCGQCSSAAAAAGSEGRSRGVVRWIHASWHHPGN